MNNGDLTTQIVQLNQKKPNATAGYIAGIVGCMPEYVRAVARRKKLTLGRVYSGKWAAKQKARREHDAPVVLVQSRSSSPVVRIKAFHGTPEQYDALARKVSLVDLGPRDCHFPIGDPKQPGFGFCGHTQAPGKTRYCQHHHDRCYPPRREKAPGS